MSQSLIQYFIQSSGPTLDVRDEVESQVVVDFETAFSTEDRKDWKPKLDLMMDNEDDESDDNRLCNAACCQDQNVHDDQYVDEGQEMEYVKHLFSDTPIDTQPSVAIVPRSLDEIHKDSDLEAQPLISNDDLIIMSYRVFGFVLRNRKWGMSNYFLLDIALINIIHSSSTRSHIHD